MEKLTKANQLLLTEKSYQAMIEYIDVLKEHDYPHIRHNIGLCYEISQQYTKAIQQYKTNVEKNPKYIRSYIGVANCYRHQHDFESSLEWMEKALSLDDVYPQTYFLLSAHYRLMNDLKKATHFCIMGYVRSAQLGAQDTVHYTHAYMDPMSTDVYTLRKGAATVLDFLYVENIPEPDIFMLHQFFDQNVGATDIVFKGKGQRGAKLKIGYISEFFVSSGILTTILPILSHHDRNNYDIHTYSLAEFEDTYTDIIRSHSRFYRNDDREEMAKKILEDKLDILISLDGHTGTQATMNTLYNRLARIQIDFLGYPFSTGKKSIDYKIVDSFTDGEDASVFYTEKLLRPNPCFLIWKPLEDFSVPPFKGITEHVRLLSPNNFKKLSETTVEMYSDILKATDDVHIYFKSSLHASGDDISDFFDLHFGRFKERVHFIDFIPDKQEHYALTSTFDIALDTYPYSGTLTTLECLYCSVPVVTLLGPHHRSRVSADILNVIGHSELVANHPGEYVDIVLKLAGDARRITKYHETLRSDLEASPIMNYQKYVNNLENSLRLL